MDFPHNVTTNDFIVENVTKIQWSQWSRVERKTTPLLYHPSDNQLVTTALIYELREKYGHVLEEAEGQGISIFDFSASPRDEFDQILASRGYSNTSRGYLDVSDPVLFGPKSSLEFSKRTMLSDQTSSSSKHESESTRLYQRAMAAICASLCHQLFSGKVSEWMPLGKSTCIDTATMGPISIQGNSPDFPSSATRMIDFNSKWNVAGRLTISPTFSEVKTLCQMTAMSLITNQDLKTGTPILLSPSGISGRYGGRLTMSDETLPDSVQSSKTRCTTFLTCQGLIVSPESEWTLVNVTRTSEREEILMLWPADYVLFKLEDMTDCSQNFGFSEPLEITDPVARAETWFLGRATRAAKVEIIQSELELQAQQQLSQDVSDHEMLSEIASPAFRDIIAPQDISGIYPTPPDGLLSQTPASNVQQGASPQFATTGRTDEHSGYGDGANEGLFEDMDMDLVGEADFNFFDEPEMEDEIIQKATDGPKEKVDNGRADKSKSNRHPALAESQVVENDRKHADKSTTVDVGPESAALGEYLSLDSNAREHNSVSSKVSPLPGIWETERSLQYQPREDDDPLNSQATHPNRGSFNPLSLAKLDFDSKYGEKGRFGYIPDEVDSQGQGKKKEIYDIMLDGIESVESDDEEAMPDNQSNYPPGYDIEDLKDALNIQKEEVNGIMSPKSSLDKADQSIRLQLGNPPSEIFFPVINQSGRTDFFQLADSPKALHSHVDHSSFIQVAQLVADQAQSLSIPSAAEMQSTLKHSYERPLLSIISKVFPSVKCHRLIDISINTELSKSLAMGIQRMGTKMDISSSAISFWEELGLGPSSGPKDLNAFCIFPKQDYLVRPVKTFLEMMKGTYQICNLGKHILDGPQSSYPHGLVPVPLSGNAFSKDAIVKFARYISSLRLTGGNFIIYMFQEGAIADICQTFLNLFQEYRLALEEEELKKPNDLVLQIVPASTIFSSHKLIIPSPTDYKRLAFQVYDRCGPTGQDFGAPFVCAPAVCLAKPTPKAIDFKLVAGPHIETGDFLHLAYKVGQQWLSASWTNSFGTIQWNAAYWLSEDEDRQTSFSQAAIAMLETTVDILQSQRASNQVLIVKDGLYDSHELNAWALPGYTTLNLSLLEGISYPSLVLFPPRSLSSLESKIYTATITNTGGHSPETSTHISTPEGTIVPSVPENDPEAKLVDITDETWTLITKNPAHETPLSSQSLSLSTGYLLKRAGTHDEDGLLPFQINIIRDSENQRVRIKEVLGIYRNLALLARVRNVIDPIKGILPIHVANARKIHTALCKSMRYTG